MLVIGGYCDEAIVLCALILLLSPVSFGADLQKGLIAAQNGDFATALRELRPLAEQGNASSQVNLGPMYMMRVEVFHRTTVRQ